VISGTTNWSSDSPFKTGQAFDMSETTQTDYVDITNIPVNTAAGAKTTVMFWMKWTSGGNGMPFCFHSSPSSHFYGIALSCGQIGFAVQGYSVYGAPFGYNQMGAWHHIAAVFYNGDIDATNNVLYIDGAKQTISACPNPSCCGTFPLTGTYREV